MVNVEGDHPRSSEAGVAVKRDENCTYTTVRKYHCAAHRDNESEAPVQKCEKTVQLLKQCAGRPAEVVESKTEYVEGDVPVEILRGSRIDSGLGGHQWSSRSFEGDLGRDVVSRALFAGFEELVQAAEEMAQEFVGRFESPYDDKHAGPRVRGSMERFPSFFSGDGSSRRRGPNDDPGNGSSDKASNMSDYSGGSQEV